MDPLSIENVVSRAADLDFPAEPLGLQVATAAEWRAVLATSTRERGVAIVAALEALEAKRREAEADRERWRARDLAAGLVEPTAEERAVGEAFRAEAAAELERYEAARPARQEALLVEIRDAVQALAKR